MTGIPQWSVVCASQGGPAESCSPRSRQSSRTPMSNAHGAQATAASSIGSSEEVCDAAAPIRKSVSRRPARGCLQQDVKHRVGTLRQLGK